MRIPRPVGLPALFLLIPLGHTLGAQESLEFGKMWTFENPPVEYLEREYGFKPDAKWLESMRLAALRLGNGGTASFVSPQGLILTNQHCVHDAIEAVQGEQSWLEDGYLARSPADELELRLTVKQLLSMTDVSAEMNAGVDAADDLATVVRKRRANEEKILARARAEKPGQELRLVTIYRGACSWLYAYKVYKDIRLVFAPHFQAARFGIDPDNFVFPRYCLDFAFCRAYENGKPADTTGHYFKWSFEGAKPEQLVFIVGNPGGTGRLQTVAELEYLRDAQYPLRLELFETELGIVSHFAEKDPAYGKRVSSSILGYQNMQKSTAGYQRGLLDPALMARKRQVEAELKRKVATDPELQARVGQAWAKLAEISRQQCILEPKLRLQVPYFSRVLARGIAIVGAVDPDAGEEAKASARRNALRPHEPSEVHDALVAAHLLRARKWLGAKDPYVALLLGELSPEAAVKRLNQSRVLDDAFVRELLAAGKEAVDASADIALRAARILAPMLKENRRQEAKLQRQKGQQSLLIGQALYACYGNRISPEGTGTLRFSDGKVRGYPMNGTLAPWCTTLYGLYGRNAAFDNQPPFDLPEIWLERQGQVDMRKALNFVATCDVIGGNSGSAVVNKDLELVGVSFDSNIEKLPNRFLYQDERARAIAVHSQAIVESLLKIYDAERVVDELRQGR